MELGAATVELGAATVELGAATVELGAATVELGAATVELGAIDHPRILMLQLRISALQSLILLPKRATMCRMQAISAYD